MKVFTYKDYIKKHTSITSKCSYGISRRKKNNYVKTRNTHDKLAKIVIKDKDEVIKFINNFIKPKEKLECNDLIKYTNSFINRKYRYKEADLVYKIKNKNVFFFNRTSVNRRWYNVN